MLSIEPSFRCDLCQSQDTEVVYVPDGTVREAKVCLCLNCGCLFSVQTKPSEPMPSSISHLASFGGIRTGKIQRAKPNLALIASAFGHRRPARVLDVGASRGYFVRELLEWSPGSVIIAVEPDVKVWPSASDRLENEGWKGERIEECDFGREVFSLIYCSHSLEHFSSPKDTLLQLRKALAPDGWLFVEVPDIGSQMGWDDINEELYLDRHLFHFTWATLHTLLEATGFVGVEGYRDGENISILARKADPVPVKPDPLTVQINRELIDTYRTNRTRNLSLLTDIAAAWNELAKEKRVVVWGIGRLFSALVGAGLDVDRLIGLWDINAEYLQGCKGEGVQGRIELPPTPPLSLSPAVVMACSRTSQAEIKAQARELLGSQVQCLGWDEV